MSPMLETMLVNEVVPRLRCAAGTIPKLGHEDEEEVVQDTTLMAARMMDSAEKAGRKFNASNIVWYATKAARSGRRSYYTGRSDALSPGCQIDGRAVHEWLDQTVELEAGEAGSLHDVLAPAGYHGCEIDPAEEAARNLDWETFLCACPDRQRVAIRVLVSGGTMRDAGRQCGLKDSAALNLRRRIAADLVEFFGEETIRHLIRGPKPDWVADLRVGQARLGRKPTGRAAGPVV